MNSEIIMEENQIQAQLMAVTARAAQYCSIVENAADYNKKEFIEELLGLLPRIYIDFFDPEMNLMETGEYFPVFVDEDYYESIRRRVETLLGEYDVFLETFEEDMKYSDTPVAASISESLADIFQALYNFTSNVKASEGTNVEEIYMECRENFESYWSQTLCNVMRALNNLRYNSNLQEEEE